MSIIEAIKLIYPTIDGGFAYWESKYDGSPLDNPIDGLKWENTEFNKPTWDQISSKLDIVYLNEAKKSKIDKLKRNRDNSNLKALVSVKAEEISIDENQQETLTGNQVYFSFSTKPTGQPATEPSTIILATLLTASVNPSFYTRYSCKIIEGEEIRDGYVKINASVAMGIQAHIQERNLTNIAFCNSIEKQINACTTVEEVETINISYNSNEH